MSYSGYGGRGFRNGIHVPECSDHSAVLIGLPMAPAGTHKYEQYKGEWHEGSDKEKGYWIKEPLPTVFGHVVLGDGPIYVELFKQSSFQIYKYGYKEPILVESDYTGSNDYQFDIDGHHIDISLRSDENCDYINNFYIFAQMIQPNGTIWSGFSGNACGGGWDQEIEEGWENTNIGQNALAKIFPLSKVEAHEMSRQYYLEFYNRRLKESVRKYWDNKEINWEEPKYEDYTLDEHENRRMNRNIASQEISDVIIAASSHNMEIKIEEQENHNENG